MSNHDYRKITKRDSMSEKETELQLKLQELQFKVWDLEKIVAGLLDALNASHAIRKRKENEGLTRI